MAPQRVLDYGDRALLLEFEDVTSALDWSVALRAARLPGVLDVVPGARTVLVEVADAGDQALVRRRLTELPIPPSGSGAGGDAVPMVLDVVYDGADLAEVASRTGLTPQAVVAAHTAQPLRVGFGGFAPGFAYLIGGDPRLRVPRRDEPRTRVPAGSVGLAGEFSGVYPRESPGGWQLIGRTEAVLWDVDRDPPALLTPGATVRFRAVDP